MTYLKQKPGSIEDVIAKQQTPYKESSYQDKFKKELDKAGRGIGSMTPKEKSAFFDKVDDIKKTKQESYQDDDNHSSALEYVLKKYGYDHKSNNPFMQRAKKKVGRVVGFQDVINQLKKEKEPGWQAKIAKMEKEVKEKDRQLSKKDPANRTISRFNKKSYEQLSKEEVVQTEALTPEKQKEHDKLMKDFIAKGGKVQKIPIGKKNFQGNKLIVRAGAKKSLAAEHNPAELNEGRWRVEGEMGYKGIGGTDNFSMVINATSEKDAINKSEKELEKARKKRWIGPGGGGNLEDIDGVYAEPTTEPLERPSSSMQHSHVPEGEKELKEGQAVGLKEKDGANTLTKTGSASRNAKKKYRFGYRVAEKQPKGNDIEEGASELIKKAVEIAKKMANNYTGATNAIEALKKGLSKDPIVSAALLKANENFEQQLKLKEYVSVGHQLWGKAAK